MLLPTDRDIGARVKRARIEAGYKSEDAFAKALGMSQPTISRLESGARRMGAAELVRIAEMLRRPPEHFLDDETSLVFFRDSGEPLSAETDVAFRWLEDFAQRLEALRTFTPKLKLPAPVSIETPVPMNWETAQAAAAEVRQRLDLGHGPAPDMFAIAERLGCVVVVRDFPEADFLAMYVPRPMGMTLINSSKNDRTSRQRFTLAHELFHHLFDRARRQVFVDFDLFAQRRDELANVFAAHFLAPREGVEAELKRRFGAPRAESAEAAYAIGYFFAISFEAACYHLTNLGFASPQATAKWRQLNRSELAAKLGVLPEQRQTEALPLEQRWPPEFIQRLRFALDARLIDTAQVRRHLREDPQAADQVLVATA
jgi:Zn-dependent peptidase ImmA (M78 family)/DNA-binding XRE family transcriptional regulator